MFSNLKISTARLVVAHVIFINTFFSHEFQFQDELGHELIFEKEKNMKEAEKNLELTAAIANIMGGFENTEKHYQTLNGMQNISSVTFFI